MSFKSAVLAGVAAAFFLVSNASAFFINFEDGVEGGLLNDILGVNFETFSGYNPLYLDSRTGNYNTHSDDLNYGWGSYHHNGNFCVWAGPNADARGVKVDFTNNDGTWFKTGFSSAYTFYVEAYLTDGSMVSVSSGGNTGSPMGFLTVNATAGTFIDYIVLHDMGNYWCVDDMSGDASGVNNVPEPSTISMLGMSLLIGWLAIRRKKA